MKLKKRKKSLGKVKRARTKKSFKLEFLTYMLENEPQTYKEIISSLEGPL